MNNSSKEKIIDIVIKLDSIIEILKILQLIDPNLDEFKDIDIPDYLELPISSLIEIKREVENI